jgi:hypothetical protein
VFDPGLGQVRAGFLVSRLQLEHFLTANRMPLCLKMLEWVQSLRRRKNKQREKNPAPGCGTYSRWKSRVKAKGRENRPKSKDLGLKGRRVSSEWRIGEAPFAIRYSLLAPNETNGFHRRCPADLQRARAKWLKTP